VPLRAKGAHFIGQKFHAAMRVRDTLPLEARLHPVVGRSMGEKIWQFKGPNIDHITTGFCDIPVDYIVKRT
jgi:hypothetical protein